MLLFQLTEPKQNTDTVPKPIYTDSLIPIPRLLFTLLYLSGLPGMTPTVTICRPI